MTARSADVLVIGGGLHGCSTALHLALAGASALVIEKNHAGRHASGVNAGGVRTLARDEAEIPLALASLALWHRIEDLVHDDCGFESHGSASRRTRPTCRRCARARRGCRRWATRTSAGSSPTSCSSACRRWRAIAAAR